MAIVNLPFNPVNPSYIDPGTGSLIIQAAIGAAVGVLVGAKVFWKRTTGFFKGLFRRNSRRDQAER